MREVLEAIKGCKGIRHVLGTGRECRGSWASRGKVASG